MLLNEAFSFYSFKISRLLRKRKLNLRTSPSLFKSVQNILVLNVAFSKRVLVLIKNGCTRPANTTQPDNRFLGHRYTEISIRISPYYKQGATTLKITGGGSFSRPVGLKSGEKSKTRTLLIFIIWQVIKNTYIVSLYSIDNKSNHFLNVLKENYV